MARTKAQALAEAGGRSLGEVVSIEEYGYNPSQRYASGGSRNMAVEETAAAADGAMAAGMGVMPRRGGRGGSGNRHLLPGIGDSLKQEICPALYTFFIKEGMDNPLRKTYNEFD